MSAGMHAMACVVAHVCVDVFIDLRVDGVTGPWAGRWMDVVYAKTRHVGIDAKLPAASFVSELPHVPRIYSTRSLTSGTRGLGVAI